MSDEDFDKRLAVIEIRIGHLEKIVYGAVGIVLISVGMAVLNYVIKGS